MAQVHRLLVDQGLSDDAESDTRKALKFAKRSVELCDTDPFSHGVLGFAYMLERRYEDAIASAWNAVAVSSTAEGHAVLGRFMSYVGQTDEAIARLQMVGRMSGNDATFTWLMGAVYRTAGRFDDAIGALEEFDHLRGGRISPTAHAHMAAAYMQTGRGDDARAVVKRIMDAAPQFTLAIADRGYPYKEAADRNAFLGALRSAGVPEG